MAKYLVGVLGHKHSGTVAGYGQNEKYMEFARKYGDVIIIDAQNDNVVPVDLLLLPGGKDVNPLRYGQKPHITTQSPDLEYEYFFTNVFHKYVEKSKEREMVIYGICAGFQQLNVFFNGSLNQDIVQDYSKSFDRGELVDTLRFIANEQVFSIPQGWYNTGSKSNTKHKTNSIHHQGVYDEKYSTSYPHSLSDEMVTLAINDVFGNVEVFKHREYLIAGEQAHPEERSNPAYTIMLINHLLKQLK